MSPLPVIEQLTIRRDLAPGLLPRGIPPVVHQLIFQRAPDTLHRGVVIAVALPTHGRGQAKLPQLILIVLGTILRSAIGVVDQPRAWTLRPRRSHQGVTHQGRRHAGLHRIPDHLTRIQSFDPRQIQPPVRRRDIGDVGHPRLIRARHGERLRQEVVRHRQSMRRVRGEREPSHRCTAQAQFLPQPLDAPDPSWKIVLTQFGSQPFRAICLTGTHMGGLDRHFQPRVLLGACRRPTDTPGIVAASGHLQNPTQQSQRILETQRPYERVPGSCAFATYAVAS